MENPRRRRLLAYFDADLKGSRDLLISKSGYTKGRVSQLFDPDESFGELAARNLAQRLGLPEDFFEHDAPVKTETPTSVGSDLPSAAHPMRFEAFTLPDSISLSWEAVEDMKLETLPTWFRVPMPDDSLAGHIDKGTVLFFEKGAVPSPGKTVLVADSEGHRFIRTFAHVRGEHWQAQARSPAYVTLDSEQHGLVVLATVRWREE